MLRALTRQPLLSGLDFDQIQARFRAWWNGEPYPPPEPPRRNLPLDELEEVLERDGDSGSDDPDSVAIEWPQIRVSVSNLVWGDGHYLPGGKITRLTSFPVFLSVPPTVCSRSAVASAATRSP